MPAHLLPDEDYPRAIRAEPGLQHWVRWSLVGIAASLAAVFFVAARLNPYRDGKLWLQETHRQLKLPPCTFKAVTGLPCPSCGMTSSFSLLMHGDVLNSLRANFVGTLLAGFFLALTPWSLSCAFQGRWLLVQEVERALGWIVLGFVLLLLARWTMVLLLHLL